MTTLFDMLNDPGELLRLQTELARVKAKSQERKEIIKLLEWDADSEDCPLCEYNYRNGHGIFCKIRKALEDQ